MPANEEQPAEPEQKPHLSPTSITMYQRCPVQFYYRYVKGIKKPPGVALLVGSSVHEAAEVDLIAKRDSGSPLEDDVVADYARDALLGRWDEEGVSLDEDEMVLGPDAVKADAVDEAVSLASVHHDDLVPDLDPDLIEHKALIPIEHETPFDLMVILDLVETNNRLSDLKTAGARRGPSLLQADADASIQLSAYHWQLTRLRGETADSTVGYNVLRKLSKPKAVRLYTTRNERDHNEVLWLARLVQTAKMKQVFVPCPKSSWWCQPRYCGYWDECSFARRDRRPKS